MVDVPLPTRSWPERPASWREGTWAPPGYRSSATRARAVQVLLVVAAIVSGLGSLILLDGVTVLGRLAEGTATDAELLAYVDTSANLSDVEVLVSIATGIAFLAWLSRAVANEPALEAGRQRHSPRASIAWWFVPFADLVMPYVIVRNLWDRLAVDHAGRSHALLVGWWLAFVVGGMLERLVALMAAGSSTVEMVRQMLYLGALGEVLMVGSAVAAVLMIREIEGRARTRAIALGVHGVTVGRGRR